MVSTFYLKIKVFFLYFNQARIPLVAAGLTFMTQLALVSLLTLILYFSTFSPQIDMFTDAFMGYLYQTLIPAGAESVFEQINLFRHQALNLKTIGFIALFLISLLFIQSIDYTFNQILEVKKPYSLWKKITIYWLFLLFLPFVIGGAVLVRDYLSDNLLLQHYPNLTALLQGLISLIFNVFFLWLFYRCLFVNQTANRAVFIAALFTVATIRAAYHLFLYYLDSVNGYTDIYGASAIVLAFLLWLNLLWLLLLSGAVGIRVLSPSQ